MNHRKYFNVSGVDHIEFTLPEELGVGGSNKDLRWNLIASSGDHLANKSVEGPSIKLLSNDVCNFFTF